ncbi:MAG: YhdH/YhfP family quinone oxidoreductase [Gammaproteobacteria bacterium]|jgi:NADPH2:quinone reductase|nr:oxidoreductase [Chromatiales bacterium]MDP6675845.1 YhdH/YhfP family quinone oxidoreductase [Gammaproteobacteria bacterium]
MPPSQDWFRSINNPFKAFRIHSEDGRRVEARLEEITLDDLGDGEVVIRGAYSSINYKDALAATGAGRILRRFPLVGGVDVAGTVISSTDPRVAEGDEVIVNGCGLSETHDGGFAEYVRVPGEWTTPMPAGVDARMAMGLGTAGFTAALAIHRMEQNDQVPELGPIVVNGATGGVGSVAIDLLSQRGYEVTALTSKTTATEYLKGLGATEVLNFKELELGERPLEKVIWGGAIDNLGGDILGWFTRTTKPNGNIASIGLAAGIDLSTTVMPFILRGISLLGINSVEVSRELRIAVWNRIAGDLAPAHLDQIVNREIELADLSRYFSDYIDGTVMGRTIVRLS